MAERQELERLFVDNLPVIDRLLRAVCRRHGVGADDANDFSSWARLRFIERDYAVLAKFRGESAIGTYLTVVIAMLFRDYCVQRRGRWRPSTEARRLEHHSHPAAPNSVASGGGRSRAAHPNRVHRSRGRSRYRCDCRAAAPGRGALARASVASDSARRPIGVAASLLGRVELRRDLRRAADLASRRQDAAAPSSK